MNVTKEILNGKLHFLCSEASRNSLLGTSAIFEIEMTATRYEPTFTNTTSEYSTIQFGKMTECSSRFNLLRFRTPLQSIKLTFMLRFSSYLMKYNWLLPTTLLKRDSIAGVFCKLWTNFQSNYSMKHMWKTIFE